MKNNTVQKICAVLLSVALIISCFTTGFAVSADSLSAEAVIAGTKFGRAPIYKEDFTVYGKGEAPAGWINDYDYPFLWRANGSWANAVAAENYDSDGMGLKIGTSKRVHIFTLPNLETEDYVVTVKAAFKDTAGSFGIATDITQDHTAASWATALEVNPADSKFKSFVRRWNPGGWAEDKYVVETTFANAACFTDNTLAAFQEFTLKAYHLNDVTYYYCNDVYVGEVADWGSGYNDRIGLYSNSSVAKVYSIEVNGLAGDGPKDVDTARVNQEAIYSENFTSYGNGKNLPEGWVNSEYNFLFNHANAMNNVSYGIWDDDSAVKYMTYKGKGGGHIMTLPSMGTENYVYTVRAKMSEYESGKGMNTVGIATDLRTDYENATSATVFEVRPTENKFNMFSRVDNGSSGADKAAVTVEFTSDYYFTNDTIALGDELILTAYHINDVSYFYCNDIYVGKVADYSTEGVNDRVGLYTYGGNLSIYEITVKEILPSATDIEEKVYISKTLVSEDFSKYSTEDALPEGWALNTNSWIWKGTGGEAFFANKTGSTALLVNGYKSTGVVVLPTLGTSDYVFTANITVRDTEHFGLLTNIDDPAETSTGATHSLLYKSEDKIYQYNRENGGYQYNKQVLNETNTIGKIPAWNGVYDLKVYSYKGVTYFFVDDVFVSAIEQRNPTPTSLCGIYSCGGSVLVNSAEVCAISGIEESESIKMQGAKIRYADANGNSTSAYSSGMSFVAAFDTTDAVYTENISNAELGMVIIPASKLAFGEKLTAQTAGAADVAIDEITPLGNGTATLEARIFNMNAVALNTDYVARAYMRVENTDGITYYYSDQITRSPVGIANLFYADATAVTDDIKARLDSMYTACEDYKGANDTTLTFSAFSDFHYKQGMYAGTVDGLEQIMARAYMNDAKFMVQCGDFSNDYKGSPEITNAYLGEKYKIPAYGVYGNHELESDGNSMALVTPLLTSRADEVSWGTENNQIGDGSIGYYYFDRDGFRMIFLDTNYSWNPSAGVWEHNATASYGPNSGNTKVNSLGPDQLAWLENVLIDAAENKLSCIVSSHESFSGTIQDVSADGEAVRALFKKANTLRPKTVILAMNGHQHTDQITTVEDVVYFNINTANNGFWMKNDTAHYTDGQTFTYVEYDDAGNETSRRQANLTELSSHKSTWFFANPISAIVTVSKSGIIKINGMETDWMYGVEPTDSVPFMDTKISSGTFGGQKEITKLSVKEQALQRGIEYNKGNRVLVWYDEFDEDALNTKNWSYEQSMTNPDVIYDNSESNIRTENNNLVMQANRTDSGYTLSQGLSTKGTMNFKYGYLEMRARIPFMQGAWPSLWAKSSPKFHEEEVGWGAEIDIVEVFASRDTLYPNLHKWSADGKTDIQSQESSIASSGYKFAQDVDPNEYHIYGFEWDANSIKFYVDGSCYYTVDLTNDFDSQTLAGMSGYNEYIYLILNNELFTANSQWKPYAGCEIAENGQLPTYEVDYVRLYQDIRTESLLVTE